MIKKIKQKIYFLLRKSEKYTKTDMVYLAKGSFWLNLGQIISSIAGLNMAIALANLLPPETYGVYKFILSFLAILTIPTLNGMNTALIRAVAQGNEGTLWPAVKEKIKWGALGTLGAFIMAGYYFYNQNIALVMCFLIMAVFIPFINTFTIWVQYLNGKKKFKLIGKYQTIMRILVVASIIITVFFTKNILVILFIYFTATTLIRFLFFTIITKKYPPNNKIDYPSIGYGKHLSLMGILTIIAKQTDKILLFHFLGPVQLAVYTFSLRPIEEMLNPLNNLAKISAPKLSQRPINDLKKSIPGKMFRLFLVMIPIVGIYILIAPYFYQFLFPKYTDSVIYSQTFALTLLFFPNMLMSQTLIAHAKKKQLYITRTLVPGFKIILFFILLPIYGIWGAIATSLLTNLFGTFILLILFKKTKC